MDRIKIECQRHSSLLELKRKDQIQKDKNVDVETIVLFTDSKNTEHFIGFLKTLVHLACSDYKILVQFSEISDIIMDRMKEIFSEENDFWTYPKQKKFLFYKPGTLLFTIDGISQISQVFYHWGKVDLINIIAVREESFNVVLDLIRESIYDFSVEHIVSLSRSSVLMMRDTGDGNEAEITYQINNLNLLTLLEKVSNIKEVDLVIKEYR